MMRGLGLALLLLFASAAQAGDLLVLSAAAVREPLEAAKSLAPDPRLSIAYGTAGSIKAGVVAGAPADILVLPPARLDELAAAGLVEPGARALGVMTLGAAVRTGAPRPAIDSPEAFRAALLSASAIGLADPASGATTGVYFAKLLKDMSLTEPLAGRIKLYSDGTAAMEALARGEVAIAAGQVSEIMPVAGIDLIGRLPAPLQLRTTYAAAVTKSSAHAVEARAAISFLASPAMAGAFAAAGFAAP